MPQFKEKELRRAIARTKSEKESAIFAFGSGETVRRPYSIQPWGSQNWRDNATWIQLIPRKIVNQGTSGRGGNLTGGESGPRFIFLAPVSIAENIGHTWGAYDSIQSRIAEKALGAAKIGADITSVVKGSQNLISGGIEGLKSGFDGTNYGNVLESIARKAYNTVGGHNVPKIKIDKPMVYQDSQRRQIIFEVNLIAEKDPKKDVLDVIQDLQKYSSPGINLKSGIDIDFPYYWEITTQPGEAIRYTTTALEAVQSTYNIPWKNGFPMQATLQLTFRDISPLFRQTIQSGSIINVIDTAENIEYKEEPGAIISNPSQSQLQKNILRATQAARAAGGHYATGKAISTRVGQGAGSGSQLGI